MPMIPQSKCEHKNVILETSGGFHFSNGEVWDDVEQRFICRDCRAEVELCGQPNPAPAELEESC